MVSKGYSETTCRTPTKMDRLSNQLLKNQVSATVNTAWIEPVGVQAPLLQYCVLEKTRIGNLSWCRNEMTVYFHEIPEWDWLVGSQYLDLYTGCLSLQAATFSLSHHVILLLRIWSVWENLWGFLNFFKIQTHQLPWGTLGAAFSCRCWELWETCERVAVLC